MKKLLLFICLVLSVLCLFSCQKGGEELISGTDAAPADWRDKIAYDGSVYVNEGVKLLYSVDKGKITLWDNAGDGAPLQTLNYDTYYDKAFDTLKFEDINLDGHKDITLIYNKKDDFTLYNLWLWNQKSGSYTAIPLYRSIYDPVISEDGKSVFGKKDMGMFGVLEMTYTFCEDLSFTKTDMDIVNAEDIAAKIASQLTASSSAEKTGTTVTLNKEECTVIAVKENGKNVAYLAYTPEGSWYIDTKCIDVFRRIGEDNGLYTLEEYTDVPGEAYERASAIYGSKNVVITDFIRGKINACEAEAYVFQLDGSRLCTIVKAENNVWYGTEGSLQDCLVISATGDFRYVEGETHQFKSIYE